MRLAWCDADLSLFVACFSPVMAPIFLQRLVAAKLPEQRKKSDQFTQWEASSAGKSRKTGYSGETGSLWTPSTTSLRSLSSEAV